MALCHGSKAKVVHHIHQKLVWKKPSLKQSVMRFPSSSRSGVLTHFTSSSRSRSEKPMECASTTVPAASTSRAWSSQAKSSWKAKVSSVTDFDGSSREGIEPSRS